MPIATPQLGLRQLQDSRVPLSVSLFFCSVQTHNFRQMLSERLAAGVREIVTSREALPKLVTDAKHRPTIHCGIDMVVFESLNPKPKKSPCGHRALAFGVVHLLPPAGCPAIGHIVPRIQAALKALNSCGLRHRSVRIEVHRLPSA